MGAMTGLRATLKIALRGLLEGDEPVRPAALAGRPVLLLHGFGSTSRVLLPLERELRRSLRRPVLRIGLGVRVPLHLSDIRASARRVHAEIERLARAPGFEGVDVVGHSMGGLVATYLLKRLDRGRHVRRVVTLGTPHHGTPLALLGVLLLGMVSRAVWQMLPGSPLLRELRRLPLPPGSALLAIGSGGDRVVPALRACLPRGQGQWSALLPRLSHWELAASGAALQLVRRALA